MAEAVAGWRWVLPDGQVCDVTAQRQHAEGYLDGFGVDSPSALWWLQHGPSVELEAPAVAPAPLVIAGWQQLQLWGSEAR